MIACETAFKQLKYTLLHAPVLSKLDFDANFVFEADASDVSLGAVLI